MRIYDVPVKKNKKAGENKAIYSIVYHSVCQFIESYYISFSKVAFMVTLLPKNLTFRPLSEAFIRRSWYSVLRVLDTTGRRCVKKPVVCVAQLIAAL